MPSICNCESIAHTDDSAPSSCKAVSCRRSGRGCENLAEFRLDAHYVICKECEASMGPSDIGPDWFKGSKYEGMMWHVPLYEESFPTWTPTS